MTKEKQVSAEVEVSKIIDKVWRPALIALIFVGIGYGGFIGYGAYSTNIEKKAQEQLFLIQKEIESKTEVLTKTNPEKKPDQAKEIEKSPKSLVENFEGQIKSYEKLIADYKGHKASFMAAIQLADLFVTYNDLVRAEATLVELASIVKGDLFGGLVLSQLGTVLMDQKKYSEAIPHFTNLVENKKQAHFHPQALLRLGTCHLESGEFEKAEGVFKRLEADFPNTQAASDAKNLLKLVRLKKGDQA